MAFTAPQPALSTIHIRRSVPAAETLVSAELCDLDERRRRRALQRLDRALSRRKYDAALSLVKQLQGKRGGLRSFGAAKQVPDSISSADKLKVSGKGLSSLEPLVDSILQSIKSSIQLASLNEVSLERLECLIMMHDENDESWFENDHLRCAQHEAGHFLVAYLLGVLPHGYKIPSMGTLKQDRFVGGRVELVGLEILHKVSELELFAVPGFPNQFEFTRAQLPSTFNPGTVVDLKSNREEIREAELRAYGLVINSFNELKPQYVEECQMIKGGKFWCIGPLSLCNKHNTDKAERGNKASIDQNECLKWLDSWPQNSVILPLLEA